MRFLRSFFTFISLLASLALLLSAANAYISPAKVSLLAFASFAFPVLWILNLVLFLIWLIKKKWQAIFLFVTLTVTFNHWSNVFQWNGRQADDAVEKRALSIMSFNVRMFDYYNWLGRDNVEQEILMFVQQQSPDILCIQEFFSFNGEQRFTQNNIIAQLGKYPFHHIEYAKIWRNGRSFGLATFSKYPIVGRDVIKFKNTTNFSIQTDVTVRGTKIRIFNNHLESIRFQTKHLNFIDSINYKSDKEWREGVSNIVHKMNTAFRVRSKQAAVVAKKIQDSPFPVIVCGDFNDTPVSYVYQQIRGKLKDAFVESGKGFGGTYNGPLPSYRIDFIFHSPQFQSFGFMRHKEDLSDHYPISCLIDLKPER